MEGVQPGTRADVSRAASSGAAVGAGVFIPLHLMLDASNPVALVIALVAALVTWRMLAAVRHRALLRDETCKGAFASAVMIVGAVTVFLPPGEMSRIVSPAAAAEGGVGICPDASAVLDDLVDEAQSHDGAAAEEVRRISVDTTSVSLQVYDEGTEIATTYARGCADQTTLRTTVALPPADAATFDLGLLAAGDINQLYEVALHGENLSPTTSDSVVIDSDQAVGEPAITVRVGSSTDQPVTIEKDADGLPR